MTSYVVNYDLKQMFEREKLSTAEDQNAMMSRLAGKSIEINRFTKT